MIGDEPAHQEKESQEVGAIEHKQGEKDRAEHREGVDDCRFMLPA